MTRLPIEHLRDIFLFDLYKTSSFTTIIHFLVVKELLELSCYMKIFRIISPSKIIYAVCYKYCRGVVKQCLRNGHMINEFDYNECCRF